MTHRCCWPLGAAMGLTFWGLAVGMALAQQPGGSPPRNPPPQAPQGGLARPPALDLRVEKLDPKLEQILRDWERESAKIQVLQGRHTRYEYNKVFSVEKQATGMFYFEAPDKGRIDMDAIPVEPGAKSSVIDPATQQPYTLAEANAQRWICTGAEVLILTPAARQFEVFPIPPTLQGQNIIDSPLPFLFGMKAGEAQRRFQLTYKGENKIAYVINAVPRLQMDAQNYKLATIALDKKTFVPQGVQLIDPAGTTMTKYVFEEIKVNPERSMLTKLLMPFGRDPDPFKPDLRGWKRILPPAAADNVPPEKNPAGGNAPLQPRSGIPQQPQRTARAFGPQ